MLRSQLVGLGALLAAGVVGLVSADAQSRRPVPMGELKQVQNFKRELNKGVDQALKKARTGRGARRNYSSDENEILDKTMFKDLIDTKLYKLTGPPTITEPEVESLQKEVNVRLDRMISSGRVTEQDRKLLKLRTINEVKRHLRR